MKGYSFHPDLPSKNVLNIIMLNGGDGSGKDTIARKFIEAQARALVLAGIATRPFMRVGFADPLKIMTHVLYGLEHSYEPTIFEDIKNEACEQFQGATPRSEYINMAERVLKPFYGRSVFARTAALSLYNRYMLLSRPFLQHTPVQSHDIIVTDLGLPEELLFPFLVAAIFDSHVNCQIYNVKRIGSSHEIDGRKEITEKELHAYFIKCLAAVTDGIKDFYYDHYIMKHVRNMLNMEDPDPRIFMSFEREPILNAVLNRQFDSNPPTLHSRQTNGVAFSFQRLENNGNFSVPLSVLLRRVMPSIDSAELQRALEYAETC